MFGTANLKCVLAINRYIAIARTMCAPEMIGGNACLD